MQIENSKKIANARAINKMRCIVGLVICLIVIALTITALILNLSNFYQEESEEAGLGTLRMYTTLSNIIASTSAAICIPFQIEGIRKNRFKLPIWVVELMHIGASGVFLTLVIVLIMIAPNSGIVYALFGNSNLFMHTLNPLFIILLFTVAVSDARIKFRSTFFAIIPTFAYALLYFVLVFVTGVWRDHYHIQDYLPWPIVFIIVMTVAYVLSWILRFFHNLTNKHVSNGIEKYYKKSPDYEFEKVSDAIAKLAKEESTYYHKGDDIYIPVDIIKLLSERYKASTLPLDIQYDIYLENYLINTHLKSPVIKDENMKE